MDRMYRERRLSKCFCGDDEPWETPNTKLQTPEKTQAPNPNDTGQSLWKLAVGASLGFGAWCLVFGYRLYQNFTCLGPGLVKNFVACFRAPTRHSRRFTVHGSTIFRKKHGTRKTPHSGTGRGQRKDLSRLLLAHDWSSRAGIQRPLREDAAAVAAAFLHQTVGLSEHLVGVGRDGGRPPKSGFEKGAQLHVRCVFRQMVRCGETLWQGSRTAPGALGFAHPRRTSGRPTRHRPVRRPHVDSQ